MSKQWTIALLALACIDVAVTQDETTTEAAPPTPCPEVKDDEEYRWSSDGHNETMECVIKLDKGYKLQVTVEDIDTNPDNKDFLVISSDSDLQQEATGIVFAHKLKSPKTFIVNSNQVLIRFEVHGEVKEEEEGGGEEEGGEEEGGEEEGGEEGGEEEGEEEEEVTYRGFSVKYKRIGEMISTTTEGPIPGSTWPTPGPGVSIYLKVFVSGFMAEDYLNHSISEKFKSSVVAMAEEYCKVNDIPVIEKITTSNVLVSKVTKCKYDWPETETCAEIKFAVPVILDPKSKDKYQLTKQDLDLMWTRYSDKYLSDGGFANYKVPDIDTAVTSWGLTLGLVIFCLVLSIGIIVVFKDCGLFQKKEEEDDNEYIIQNDKRISGDSLSPYPVQSFPSIFEQEDKSFASYFDKQHGGNGGVQENVSDDDSENDVFSAPNFTNKAFESDL